MAKKAKKNDAEVQVTEEVKEVKDMTVPELTEHVKSLGMTVAGKPTKTLLLGMIAGYEAGKSKGKGPRDFTVEKFKASYSNDSKQAQVYRRVFKDLNNADPKCPKHTREARLAVAIMIDMNMFTKEQVAAFEAMLPSKS